MKDSSSPAHLTRRAALRLIGLGGGIALLSACAPAAQAPTPTTAPAKPTPAPAATPTTAPAAAATPTPAAKPTAPAAMTPTAAPAAATPTTAPAVAGKVPTGNLRLMGWSSSPEEDRLLNEVLQDFMRQYPSIQVRFEPTAEYATKLQTDLAAGTAADVFYVDSLLAPDLMKRGLLLELDSYIQQDRVDLNDFYPGLLKAFQWRGKTYGLPKDWSSLGLEWNQEAAAAAGVDKAPATWDELRATAQKLTDKAKNVFGFVTPPDLARFGAFVFQAGGRLISEDGTKVALNSPEGLQALEFYYGLYKDGIATTPADTGTGWPGDTFAKGKAHMIMEGNWVFPFLKKEAPNLKFGIAELPAGPKGKSTFAFTVSYSVNAKTQQKDAAWFLVNYLTGPVGMKKWTSLGLAMPSRKSLEADWINQFKEREPFLKAGPYAQGWQMGAGGQQVYEKVVNPTLQDVFAGKTSPKDALAKIEREGNAILERQA
jgi:multiple sugar transport system substrate-binding protein